MEKVNTNNVIMELEDQYKLHDRRAEGWKLVGFVGGAKPANTYKNSINYPYGVVPVWRYIGWHKSKYNGAKLREIRAKDDRR